MRWREPGMPPYRGIGGPVTTTLISVARAGEVAPRFADICWTWGCGARSWAGHSLVVLMEEEGYSGQGRGDGTKMPMPMPMQGRETLRADVPAHTAPA
jgi:hypothetical protein